VSENLGSKFLTKTEKLYLEALAKYPTIKDAALALGVSPRTLYNWCYNFRKRYEARRGWINSVLNYKRKSALITKILSKRVPLEEVGEE